MKMPLAKRAITTVNIPRFIPHLILYLVFKQQCLDDVEINVKKWGYNCGNIIAFFYLLTFDRTFRNLYYFRIGKWQYLIKWLALEHPSFRLYPYMKMGPGVMLVHPFATVVNAKSIGTHFSIKNNCTIGNNRGGVPQILDNVSINVNSVVVGDIVIGNNVVIGAGSVVMKSVPDNCVVVGNPARILKRNGILVNEKL